MDWSLSATHTLLRDFWTEANEGDIDIQTELDNCSVVSSTPLNVAPKFSKIHQSTDTEESKTLLTLLKGKDLIPFQETLLKIYLNVMWKQRKMNLTPIEVERISSMISRKNIVRMGS